MIRSWSRKIPTGLVVGVVLGIFGAAAAAETRPLPLGAPILKVILTADATAADGTPVAATESAFDLDMLKALPVTTFRTSTVWTEGVSEFTGVSLADFAKAMNVTSGTMLMYAVNDYVAEVPISDAVEGGPILAYLMDGQEMAVRDKGPIWVIYPYDSSPEFQTEVVYSRSIWQLVKIEFKP